MTRVRIRMKTDYVRKDGTCQLFAQVSLKGRIVKLPIDVSIEPVFWDQDNELVKDIHPQAEDLNLMTDQVRARIFEIRKRYALQNKDLFPEQLKNEYKLWSVNDGDFIVWAKKMIERRRGEIFASTQKQHRSIINKLETFRKTIAFGELTPELLIQFQAFMRSKYKNNLTTIASGMRVIKTYVKLAIRHELIVVNPFDHVKVRKGKPTIVYLNEQERDAMMAMFQNEFTSSKHKRVLHYFLFACYTGLRISDIKRLRWEYIVNDTIYIQAFKTRRTTGETVIIPLGAKARWLLSKIEHRPRNPYVFDVISEQKTNAYLKEIAEILGIQKSIHFHLGRHTFATLFYEKTNDLATLQKLLGHADIESTMIYAHVSDNLRRDQMKMFDADETETES
jgi:integrase/recombinase XerD